MELMDWIREHRDVLAWALGGLGAFALAVVTLLVVRRTSIGAKTGGVAAESIHARDITTNENRTTGRDA